MQGDRKKVLFASCLQLYSSLVQGTVKRNCPTRCNKCFLLRFPTLVSFGGGGVGTLVLEHCYRGVFLMSCWEMFYSPLAVKKRGKQVLVRLLIEASPLAIADGLCLLFFFQVAQQPTGKIQIEDSGKFQLIHISLWVLWSMGKMWVLWSMGNQTTPNSSIFFSVYVQLTTQRGGGREGS